MICDCIACCDSVSAFGSAILLCTACLSKDAFIFYTLYDQSISIASLSLYTLYMQQLYTHPLGQGTGPKLQQINTLIWHTHLICTYNPSLSCHTTHHCTKTSRKSMAFLYSAFFEAFVRSFINANTNAYPLIAKMTEIPASRHP